MIMVDELRIWPTKIRCFRSGSCHLTTDSHVDELHEFAARLGLRREWFQEHPIMPHYDLTPGRRAHALRLGAIEISARDQVIKIRAARRPVGGAK